MSDQLKRNTRSTFIAGDFNAVIADGNKQYPKNKGSYSKGTTNENGPFLIDFLIQNNLYATNTFFQHLYTNIIAWQNNNYPAYSKIHLGTKSTLFQHIHLGKGTIQVRNH